MFVTLDGVVQGLGRPDEDTRDGFTHGGWGPRYNDEVMGAGSAPSTSGPSLLSVLTGYRRASAPDSAEERGSAEGKAPETGTFFTVWPGSSAVTRRTRGPAWPVWE